MQCRKVPAPGSAALRPPGDVVQKTMPYRPHRLVLSSRPEPYGSRLQADLPDGAAGRWCRLIVTGGNGGEWWAKAELRDEARGQVVREVFLGPRRPHRGPIWRGHTRRDPGFDAAMSGGAGRRETLVHIPQAARSITLLIFAAERARPAVNTSTDGAAAPESPAKAPADHPPFDQPRAPEPAPAFGNGRPADRHHPGPCPHGRGGAAALVRVAPSPLPPPQARRPVPLPD